jgi:hypothetical protein
VTNSHARSSKASPIATDMSRLANISPTSAAHGQRVRIEPVRPHATMYQA